MNARMNDGLTDRLMCRDYDVI